MRMCLPRVKLRRGRVWEGGEESFLAAFAKFLYFVATDELSCPTISLLLRQYFNELGIFTIWDFMEFTFTPLLRPYASMSLLIVQQDNETKIKPIHEFMLINGSTTI